MRANGQNCLPFQGANLLNGNLDSIVDLAELCDRYGMDTISTSNTIRLAFRLFDKGIITEEDTGGMVLRWGDVDVIEQLVRLTDSREGNEKLPKALLEPFPDGGPAGFVPDLEGMLIADYQHRGWDPKTEKPRREKIIELESEDVAQDLWGNQ